MRSLSGVMRLSSALGAAPSAAFVASLAGVGGCRLRALATATAPAEQGKPQPIPDALDQEFDRGDDEAMAAMREAEYEAMQVVRREAGLKGRPVDLECEFDRDDPECVDTAELYADRTPEVLLEVDIETEMDRDDPLLADKRYLWEPPPPPPEVDIELELDRDDPLLADKRGLWERREPPCPANIDDELDMMANGEEMLRSFKQQEAAPAAAVAGESPGGTVAGNMPFGRGAARQPPEKPDPRIGQYRERKQVA